MWVFLVGELSPGAGQSTGSRRLQRRESVRCLLAWLQSWRLGNPMWKLVGPRVLDPSWPLLHSCAVFLRPYLVCLPWYDECRVRDNVS
uniref:Uncharacterized protein n=1 Tax=Arundo donax TaxID=35708 RepID=A0A0A9E5T5_ARUDO